LGYNSLFFNLFINNPKSICSKKDALKLVFEGFEMKQNKCRKPYKKVAKNAPKFVKNPLLIKKEEVPSIIKIHPKLAKPYKN
jgi:hypothetical protein